MAWFREWLRGGPDDAVGGDGAVGSSGTHSGAGTLPPTAPPAPSASSASPSRPTPSVDEATSYPGERFGLPESGVGSVATLARRGAQFVLDAVLAGLVASLFTYPALPQNWSLVSWAVLMVVPVAAFGMTPAMAMLGIRVVRLDRPSANGVGPVWALVRTFSLLFVVPGLIVDRDGRGVQDRASRTVVLRTR